MTDKEDIKIVYKLMKQRDISTLSLHRALERLGVDVAKKTLHTYLLTGFKNAKDDRLKIEALEMIKSYDNMIDNLKTKI